MMKANTRRMMMKTICSSTTCAPSSARLAAKHLLPSIILWWNRTRKKVYAAQDYHCFCCGVHQDHQSGWIRGQLDCHEVYDIDWKTGRVTLKELVGLCKQCHSYIHFGRLFAQRDAGKIQDKTFYATLLFRLLLFLLLFGYLCGSSLSSHSIAFSL